MNDKIKFDYWKILIACFFALMLTGFLMWTFDSLIFMVLFLIVAVLSLIIFIMTMVTECKNEKNKEETQIKSFIESWKEDNVLPNIALLYEMHINNKFNKLKDEGINIYTFLDKFSEAYEIELVKDNKTMRLIFDEDYVYTAKTDSFKTDLNSAKYDEFTIKFENEDDVLKYIKNKYNEL